MLTTIVSKNSNNTGRIVMYVSSQLLNKSYLVNSGGNCTPNVCLSIVPIDVGRKLVIEWSERSFGENNLQVNGYRRIGNNY